MKLKTLLVLLMASCHTYLFSYNCTESSKTDNSFFASSVIHSGLNTVGVTITLDAEDPLSIDEKGGGPATKYFIHGESYLYSRFLQNTGTTAIDSADLKLYISTDTIIDASDIILKDTSYQSPAFTPGNYFWTDFLIEVDESIAPGEYFILERYVFYASETSQHLEILSQWIVDVAAPFVDLAIDKLDVEKEIVESGGEIRVTAYVQNNGNVPCEASKVAYYLSEDMNLDVNDCKLGSVDLPVIEDQETRVNYLRTSIIAPELKSGTYYLLAYADEQDVLPEPDEENNLCISQIMFIQHGSIENNISIDKPELPESLFLGDYIIAQSNLHMDFDIPSLEIRMYLSADSILNEGDVLLRDHQLNFSNSTVGTSNISIGAYVKEEHMTSLDFGEIFIILSCDEQDMYLESTQEDNIVFSSFLISTTREPDISPINASIKADSLLPGQRMDFRCGIMNSGNAFCSYSYLGLMLSTDTVFDAGDVLLHQQYVDSNRPNTTRIVENHFDIGNNAPGEYYILFVADYSSRIDEVDEDNNVMAVPFRIIDATTIQGIDLELFSMEIRDTLFAGMYGDLTCEFFFHSANDEVINLSGYVSEDTILDIDDLNRHMIGRNLFPPAYTHMSEYIYFDAYEVAESKDYYVIIKGDAENRILEDDESNNELYAKTFIYSTYDIMDLAVEEFILYKSFVPAGAWLDGRYRIDNYAESDIDSLVITIFLTESDGDISGHLPLFSDTVFENNNGNYFGYFNLQLPDTCSEGMYNVVIEVSSSQSFVEYNHDDNSSSRSIGVSTGDIDLKVRQLSLLSEPFMNDSRSDITLEIENSGNIACPDPWIKVYLSTDEEWSSDDLLVDSVKVSDLGIGKALHVDTDIFVRQEISAGEYHLIAVADPSGFIPDTDRSNNYTSIPVELIAKGYNYTISSFSVDQNILTAGQTYTMSYTVLNDGNISSENSYIQFYLSTDTIQDDEDTYLGGQTVYSIIAGSTSDGNRSATISSSLSYGHYYLLAVVDKNNYKEELDEEDNISYLQIEVIPPEYDLEVSSLSVPDTLKVTIGSVNQLSCNVINNGIHAYFGSLAMFVYLSIDTILDPLTDAKLSSTQHTMDYSPGKGHDYSFYLRLSDSWPKGEYYCFLVLDPDNEIDETNEENNTFVFPLAIVEPNVDLTTTSLVVEQDTVFPGNTFDLQFVIENLGETSTETFFTNRVYLSKDTMFSEDDQYRRDYNCNAIMGLSSCSDHLSVYLSPDQAPGDYYLLFISDYDGRIEELNEENNLAYTPLVIGEVIYDLYPVDYRISSDDVEPGDRITLYCDVLNCGNASVLEYSYLGYYLSSDSLFSENDIQLSLDQVSRLSAGARGSESESVYIPEVSRGEYYILFVTDIYESIEEADEDNNVAGIPISIGMTELLPDLSIESYYIGRQGTKLQLDFTVANIGTEASLLPVSGKIVFSEDWDLEESDLQVQSVTVPVLPVGEDSTFSYFLDPPGAEYRYVFVQIDTEDVLQEYEEILNNFIRVLMYIDYLDIQVTTAEPEKFAPAGAWVEIESTVSNNSGMNWENTLVNYYLSLDSIIDSQDTLLYSDRIPMLVEEENKQISHSVIVPDELGLGDYVLIIGTNEDTLWMEPNFVNNFDYIDLHVIRAETDLEIISADSDDKVVAGESIQVKALVRNIGDQNSGDCLMEYLLSADEEFDTNDKLLHKINYGPLASLDSSLLESEFTVPESVEPGEYHLILHTYELSSFGELYLDNNTVSAFLEVEEGTGIQDPVASQWEVNLYPNPAKEVMCIDSDIRISGYQVISMQGKMLATYDAHEKLIDIPVSSYPDGSYILVIRSEQGRKIIPFKVLR